MRVTVGILLVAVALALAAGALRLGTGVGGPAWATGADTWAGVRVAGVAAVRDGARGPADDGQHASAVPLAVSARTAARLGLRVGDLVEIGAEPSLKRARRARVVAVWEGPEHPADVARQEAQVRLPLSVLEAVLGREDTVDRIVVRLHAGADPARVRDDLRAMVAGADVYTAADLAERTSRAFAVIARFHRAIGAVTMLASGVFLVAIVSLKLSELRRDLGALRLVGIGAGTVWLTVAGLAAVVALVGTAAGVALGAVLTWGINAYYRPLLDSALVFARLEGRTVVRAVTLAVVVALSAGVVTAARLARRRPLDLVGR